VTSFEIWEAEHEHYGGEQMHIAEQLFPTRCQHGAEGYYQCALRIGHDGPHETEGQVRERQRLNANPTLDVIRDAVRQVIREELKKAGLT
jgi:hypothetical protein